MNDNPYEELLKYLDVVQPGGVSEMYVAIEEFRKAFDEGKKVPKPKVSHGYLLSLEDIKRVYYDCCSDTIKLRRKR